MIWLRGSCFAVAACGNVRMPAAGAGDRDKPAYLTAPYACGTLQT